MNWPERIAFWLVVIGLVSSAFLLAGCVSTTPSCRDNPRNMQCMSADQLERELNK